MFCSQVDECDKPPQVNAQKLPKYMALKKGEQFGCRIPFRGFPIPNIVLMVNGEEAKGVNLKAIPGQRMLDLQLDEAAREDAGKYELVFKNPSGEERVPFEINVLGK